jgi:hypothetical protein
VAFSPAAVLRPRLRPAWPPALAVAVALAWSAPGLAQDPPFRFDSPAPMSTPPALGAAIGWNAGLVRVVGRENVDFSTPWRKTATAFCPEGKWVTGGGARIIDSSSSSDPNRPRLSVAFPYHSPFGTGDFFYAHGEIPQTDTTPVSYTLEAYAVCANPSAFDGYTPVYRHSARDTRIFKDTAAVCPAGTVAFGSGAYTLGFGEGEETYGGHGKIGLQLVRTSGPLDITRATARAQGYSGPWEVVAVAICAEPAGNVHVEGALSQTAEATASCPAGYLVAGPGGGGGLTDGGPVWLRKIYPRPDLTRVDVGLTAPLAPSIGGMVAHFTCVQGPPPPRTCSPSQRCCPSPTLCEECVPIDAECQ